MLTAALASASPGVSSAMSSTPAPRSLSSAARVTRSTSGSSPAQKPDGRPSRRPAAGSVCAGWPSPARIASSSAMSSMLAASGPGVSRVCEIGVMPAPS